MEPLPPELEALARFHGHLGPYVVVGYRMGAVAHREFGGYKGLTAEVACVTKPPMLCVVDGVQFSSQCTLGKGNIAVKEGPTPVAVFRKEGREITIRLPESLRDRIDREMSKEKEVEQSLFFFRMPEAELLEIAER